MKKYVNEIDAEKKKLRKIKNKRKLTNEQLKDISGGTTPGHKYVDVA